MWPELVIIAILGIAVLVLIFGHSSTLHSIETKIDSWIAGEKKVADADAVKVKADAQKDVAKL
jgi:hypothetical protein